MVAYDLAGIDDRVQLDLFSASARQRRLDVAIDELAERLVATSCIEPTSSPNQAG